MGTRTLMVMRSFRTGGTARGGRSYMTSREIVATADPGATLPCTLDRMAASPATVIIAVGDEVLSGHTQDTNSFFLAQRAFAAGFPVRRIEVVADRIDEVVAAVHRALADTGV